ncbi:retrovirus-related Pol polyprotein from transposon 412 [Trichonephila clavipes]|nr:retrovirus-related Pol polyprotein from transposon 412 [Trichonephila clavipes]
MSVPVSEFPEPLLASPMPAAALTGPVKLSTYDRKTNWERRSHRNIADLTRHRATEIELLYNALDLRISQKYSKEYARLQMKTRLRKPRKLAGVCLRRRKARQLSFLRPPSKYKRSNLFTVFRGRSEGAGKQKAVRMADVQDLKSALFYFLEAANEASCRETAIPSEKLESAVHETTGYSPSQMLFGRDLNLRADLLFSRPPDAPLVPEEYIEKLLARMEEMHHLASERISMASEKIKTL